jgi:hypothetical protein
MIGNAKTFAVGAGADVVGLGIFALLRRYEGRSLTGMGLGRESSAGNY